MVVGLRLTVGLHSRACPVVFRISCIQAKVTNVEAMMTDKRRSEEILAAKGRELEVGWCLKQH